MRTSTTAFALALALSGAAPSVFAQDAGSPRAADASAAPTLPPGHPTMEGPAQQAPELHPAQMPETFAEETPGIPPGVIVARVVNAAGAPVAGASVRFGSMHEGEPGPAQNVVTDADGIARAENLEVTGSTAYRVSVEAEGARFGAPPFQLSPGAGQRVQIVRFDVDHNTRAVLLWDARVEIHFKDDRLIVVERINLVNLSGMSFGGGPAHPVAWVPTEPVRFAIPEGHTAFTVAPSMADLRVTEEGNEAVFRGSLPPTGTEPVEIAFQYHIKLSGGDVDLRLGLPLPVVASTIASEAPRGLTLTVDGMPTPERRDSNGQQVLITGLERRPNDPALRELRIHLGGIPAAAGPSRMVASAIAALMVLGAMVWGFSRRRRAAEKRDRAVVEAERLRVIDEARELAKLHREGEVGPVNFEKRKRELALWLAAILKEQSEL